MSMTMISDTVESPLIQSGSTHTAQMADLITALVKAQAQMSNPTLDSTNPHYKTRYASLAAVRNAVMPALTAHGLAVTQLVQAAGSYVTCTTILWHTSGQMLTSTLTLPVNKADAQGIGGAITYARRYSLAALCNVVGEEDDDGNSAVEDTPHARTPRAARPTPPSTSVVAPVRTEVSASYEALKLEIKTGLQDVIRPLNHAGLFKAVIFHCFQCAWDAVPSQSLAVLEQGIALFRHLCAELDTQGRGVLQPDDQGQATLPPDQWIAQEMRKLAQQAAREQADPEAGFPEVSDLDTAYIPELVA